MEKPAPSSPNGIICPKCGSWHWTLHCPVCGRLKDSNK